MRLKVVLVWLWLLASGAALLWALLAGAKLLGARFQREVVEQDWPYWWELPPDQ